MEKGLLARVVMFGSWVDDAVWMELLHGGSLRLFLVFFSPAPAMQDNRKKIKCNMKFLDDAFVLCLLVIFHFIFICLCVTVE